MADRRASIRHRSPISEASPDYHEGDGGAKSLLSRRRPVRGTTAIDEIVQPPASSIWVNTDRGDTRKPNGRASSSSSSSSSSRKPYKKTSTSNSSTSSDSSPVDQEHGTGFLPKLGRILERRDGRSTRNRRDSAISADTPSRRRPRPIEDATLNRRPVRQKHGSLQRRVESLSELPNPSLVSVLSGLTQLSGASTESTSTITQQSYDRSNMFKRKPPAGKRAHSKRSGESNAVDRQQSNVLHYIKRGWNPQQFEQQARPSTASSASSASSAQTESTVDDDDDSSVAQVHVESPLTSPASILRPDSQGSHVDEEDGEAEEDESSAGISVREASPDPVHQPSVSDAVDEEDEREHVDSEDEEGEEDDHDHDDDDVSSEEEYDDEEEEEVITGAEEHAHYAHHMALERMPPPRLPSSPSSRHSDRHSRRLKRQEQALSEHVLQPQPHRDFHFVGAPSLHTNHTVPLYSPHMHAGASPATYHATAASNLPSAPPPPQMGYHSPSYATAMPYPPGYEGNFAMVPHPPMGPPSVIGPPPVPPYPPQYQVQATQATQAMHSTHLTRHTSTGYELLADKLSEGPGASEERVVPLYRKFEYLNHRVLLHIQDEIAEMEEELRDIDGSLGQYSPRDEAGRMHPASRRSETRYGNEMHYRRTELLGRIYLKLGQYNSALSSYGNMIKDMAPAESDEVQAYRAWMEKRRPIDGGETAFLEGKDDLVAVGQRRTVSVVGGASPHQSAAIWLPMILVMPLMAFAIVPGLLGRLFILCSIGAAIMKLLRSTQELRELLTEREWAGCFSAYFGVMAVLAAVVH